MDKQRVKHTMLDLEQKQFDASREAYLAFVSSARLDRSEPVENDEQAQAEFASDLSEAFDQPVHAHAEKIERLKNISFAPKKAVEEGSIVKIMDRWFAVAVATAPFTCEGMEMMGVSLEAPLFRAIRGKVEGDRCAFNGRRFSIDVVE